MSQATIFVIDDEFDILAFMEMVIAEAGHRVETFTDGNKAIDQMRKVPPDMVFLDLHMPTINGFQVLQAIRQVGRFDDVPVVLMSAIGAITGSEYCPETLELRYGVKPDAFASKPVLPEAIYGHLKAFIKQN